VITLRSTTPTGQTMSNVSYPDYVEVRDGVQSFEGLASTQMVAAGLAHDATQSAQGVLGTAVSANYFDVLRVPPALGRGFTAEEDRVPGRDAVVVLAHETWTERFGADPNIIGRTIRLSGQPFTVVGVAPGTFTGTAMFAPASFYVPMAMLPSLNAVAGPDQLQRRDLRSVRLLGRLAPGVALEQAAGEVRRFGESLARAYPATNEGFGLLLDREIDARLSQNSQLTALAMMLIGLAVAVLLVACANVAGLLTSRAPVRAREIALRLAIGGSRQRLVRQLITETALVAVAGAVAGLGLGYLGIVSFRALQVPAMGVRLSYELDGRALTVGMVIAGVAALLSSAIPAWRSTRATDLSGTLRNTTTPAARSARLWGRHGLVMTQIALTLVVLTLAVSFYRAFENEYSRGPGFRTDHILLTELDPGLGGYDQERADRFYQLLRDRVAALPGVRSAALTSFVPLSQSGGGLVNAVPEGVTLPRGVRSLPIGAARVDAGYLGAIGIPIVSGRGISATDTGDTPGVAVVNRGLAARYWPDQNPLGKRIQIDGPRGGSVEVVGVAADAKFAIFTPNSRPFIYLSRLQFPVARQTLVVHTASESAGITTLVRDAIAATDRNVPVVGTWTMEAYYYLSAKNLNSVVVRTVAGMGALGLVLALVGLYGLMAYAVSRRTREIGIRMAMGAVPGSVLRLILRQGSLSAVAGIAFGMLASVAVGNTIQAFFPNTGASVSTFLLIVPAVIVVVTLAAYLPARRAALIDPLAALRQD
jgi:predicted permease